jgi:O-antigen/teichoic acid export membrane protein
MGVNKQKLVKSGIWQFSNTIVIIVSQIVCNAIIARCVSKKEFGIMAITNAFINFASFFSEAGMGDALMQRRDSELEPQHKNAALFFSVLFSVIIYFILYFTAPLISLFYDNPIVKSDLFYNNEPILVPVLRVLGLSFIFLSLGSSSLNLLQKNFKFKHVFFSDSLSLLVSNILGVVLAINHWGVWSLVYSILFYNVARLIMVWILEPIPIWIGATLRHWKDLFNYGVGLTLIRVYNFFSGFGIMLEIGKLVPIQMLGIFERSYRITNIPVRYLGDMIQKVMMPFMVKINNEDDKLFQFFYRGMSFSNALLVPVSVFAFVFCKPIVLILLGGKWSDAVLPMQILFLSLPFRITTKVSDVLMRAKNLVYKNANRKLQYVIVLCIAVFFSSKWGLTGIAIAVSVSAVFSYVTMLMTIKKRVFQHGWQKLIITPFKTGAIISVFTVAPAYLIYYLLMLIFNKDIIAFSILCMVLVCFFSYAFFKNPILLGKDFVQLQKELVTMIKNKGKREGKGNRSKEKLEEQETNITPGIA